jgi:hypothetical protein
VAQNCTDSPTSKLAALGVSVTLTGNVSRFISQTDNKPNNKKANNANLEALFIQLSPAASLF